MVEPVQGCRTSISDDPSYASQIRHQISLKNKVMVCNPVSQPQHQFDLLPQHLAVEPKGYMGEVGLNPIFPNGLPKAFPQLALPKQNGPRAWRMFSDAGAVLLESSAPRPLGCGALRWFRLWRLPWRKPRHICVQRCSFHRPRLPCPKQLSLRSGLLVPPRWSGRSGALRFPRG